MIQNMFIYGPIILWGAAVIVLLFYKLDKHYGTIMADLKGKADGKLINKVISEIASK